MVVLGVVLSGLWCLYVELLRTKVYGIKINFEVKKMEKEKKEKLVQAKQQ